ncbi:hypothetical protein U9M48_002354 [Paspalum notatum var. saurae]|uniref:Uncharacterized protein n=1 Tax=Paspalum notatum var. saurae TaxID=547442 RepID=A0AAQ3PFX9_PASNO
MASPPLAPSPSAPPQLPASTPLPRRLSSFSPSRPSSTSLLHGRRPSGQQATTSCLPSPCHGAATAPPPHLLEELPNRRSSLHCLLQAPATTGSAPGPPSFAVPRPLLADFAERRLWLHLDIKQRQPLQIDARALLSTAARHQRRYLPNVRQISPTTSSSMSPKVSLHFRSPFHSIVCCVPSSIHFFAMRMMPVRTVLFSNPSPAVELWILSYWSLEAPTFCPLQAATRPHSITKSDGDAVRHGVASFRRQLVPASSLAPPRTLGDGSECEMVCEIGWRESAPN